LYPNLLNFTRFSTYVVTHARELLLLSHLVKELLVYLYRKSSQLLATNHHNYSEAYLSVNIPHTIRLNPVTRQYCY